MDKSYFLRIPRRRPGVGAAVKMTCGVGLLCSLSECPGSSPSSVPDQLPADARPVTREVTAQAVGPLTQEPQRACLGRGVGLAHPQLLWAFQQ